MTRARWQAVLDAEAGGRLRSLRLDGLELLVTSDDPHVAGDPLAWGAYVMAPWAGRVRRGRFRFGGVAHDLPLRMPPHAIHGTVVDRPWRMVSQDLPTAVLHAGDTAACVVDLGDDWPFRGMVRHTVSVTAASVRCELDVHVVEPQPVVVGWHPWLRTTLADGSRHALDLRADAMLARDADGLPGAPVPVTDGPWDDTFVGVDTPIGVRWGDHEIALDSSCGTWVVFDERDHGFCVEPQTAPPDAFNRGEAVVVTPDVPLRAWFELTAVRPRHDGPRAATDGHP